MNTKSLKQKILDLAIRGKLVPQDPNDEPASVLLQRIRAEREQLIAQGKIKRSKTTSDNQHYENVPFEIPASWEWVRLEDVVMAVTDGDHQPPPQASEGVPFLVISDVNTGRINFNNARFVSKSYYDSLPWIKKATEGDILFTVTGSYGIVINVDTQREFCFQRHIGLIKTILCSRWLTIALQSQYVKQYCDDIATGTAQKTVSLGFLRALCIPIPPLAEQERIVNEIEQWFKCIDEIEKETTALQDIARQTKSKVLSLAISGKLVPQEPTDEPAIELLKRINLAFKPCDTSHYENLPQGWSECKVDAIADVISGVSYDKSDIKESGLKILRGGNVQDGKIVEQDDDVYISEKYINDSNTVKQGDIILVASTGSKTLIGKTGFAEKTYHNTQIGAFLRIIRAKDLSLCEYLNFIFLSESFKKHIRQLASGTNINNVKNKYITEFVLALPPKNEIPRIIKKVNDIFAQIDNITAEL